MAGQEARSPAAVGGLRHDAVFAFRQRGRELPIPGGIGQHDAEDDVSIDDRDQATRVAWPERIPDVYRGVLAVVAPPPTWSWNVGDGTLTFPAASMVTAEKL